MEIEKLIKQYDEYDKKQLVAQAKEAQKEMFPFIYSLNEGDTIGAMDMLNDIMFAFTGAACGASGGMNDDKAYIIGDLIEGCDDADFDAPYFAQYNRMPNDKELNKLKELIDGAISMGEMGKKYANAIARLMTCLAVAGDSTTEDYIKICNNIFSIE